MVGSHSARRLLGDGLKGVRITILLDASCKEGDRDARHTRPQTVHITETTPEYGSEAGDRVARAASA